MFSFCHPRSLRRETEAMELAAKHARTQKKPPFLFDVLPNDLCLFIIVDWLGTMLDISYLDIAICNRVQRRHFHQILAGKLAFGRYPGMDSPRHFRWLYHRAMCAGTSTRLIVTELPALVPCSAVFHTVQALTLAIHRSIYPLNSCSSSGAISKSLYPYLHHCFSKIFEQCRSLWRLHLQALDGRTAQIVADSGRALHISSLEISDVITAQSERTLLQMLLQWGPELEVLSIHKSYGYGDRTLAAIALHCSALRHLDFTCNRSAVSAQAIVHCLSALPVLSSLCIADGSARNITVAVLETVLPHLPRLLGIKLICENSILSAVPLIFAHCPHIEAVEVNHLKVACPPDATASMHFTAEFAEHVARCAFPQPIHTVKITAFSGVVPFEGVLALLEAVGPQLRVFDHDAGHLTPQIVGLVFERCQHLVAFHSRRGRLQACNFSALVQHMLPAAHRLTHLTLRSWKGLRDEHMLGLLMRCAQLEQLEIVCCEDVTDATFSHCLTHCPALRKLVLGHCKLTSKGIAEAFCAHHGHSSLVSFELVGVSKLFCDNIKQVCKSWMNRSAP